jgi:hypothetical protein
LATFWFSFKTTRFSRFSEVREALFEVSILPHVEKTLSEPEEETGTPK